MEQIHLQEISKNNIKGLEEFVEIISENYTDRPFPFTVDKARNSSTIYFKALQNQVVIGVTGIDIKTPFLAETVKTVIKKDFRGKKLGAELSLAVEKECFKRGIKKVMTTIYANNFPMISIKLKQGYRIEGFHPDHEAPGFDEYSLGKILA